MSVKFTNWSKYSGLLDSRSKGTEEEQREFWGEFVAFCWRDHYCYKNPGYTIGKLLEVSDEIDDAAFKSAMETYDGPANWKKRLDAHSSLASIAAVLALPAVQVSVKNDGTIKVRGGPASDKLWFEAGINASKV